MIAAERSRLRLLLRLRSRTLTNRRSLRRMKRESLAHRTDLSARPFSLLRKLSMLRWARRLFPVLLLLSLAGCGTDEPIQSYDVPKAIEYSGRQTPPGEYRILGAMFPASDPVWFFKFQGRAADVKKYETDFDMLLATVKLMPDKKGDGKHPDEPTPPQFVAPASWERLGERIVRRDGITLRIYETLRFGPQEAPNEVTLTYSGGTVHDNLGRWAAQLGLPQPRPEDVSKFTRVISGDGVLGLRVDIAGPNNPAAGIRMKK